jgi:hypothetical protein
VGKIPLARKIFFEMREKHKGNNGTWIVLYLFNDKPNSRFYDNLNRLKGMLENNTVFPSCFITDSKAGALTLQKLVNHYGGEVLVYKGELLVTTSD